jgi:hypothetical protein
MLYRDKLEISHYFQFPLTLGQEAWIVNPTKFFLLIQNPCNGQARPPPAVQLWKRYVCMESVGLTQYTSVSTTTWSICGWTTRNWQSKGMLMSVKNCSRDVLVSRNSSQMTIDQSVHVSTNVCKKMIAVLFFWNEILIAFNFTFGNINGIWSIFI